MHLEDSSQGLLQSKVLDLRGGVLAPGARRLRACIIRHNLFCTGSSFDSLMKESRPQCHLLLSSWCSVLAKGVLSQNLDFHSRERHTEGPARGVETERERERERWRDMERERERWIWRERARERERERERGGDRRSQREGKGQRQRERERESVRDLQHKGQKVGQTYAWRGEILIFRGILTAGVHSKRTRLGDCLS